MIIADCENPNEWSVEISDFGHSFRLESVIYAQLNGDQVRWQHVETKHDREGDVLWWLYRETRGQRMLRIFND